MLQKLLKFFKKDQTEVIAASHSFIGKPFEYDLETFSKLPHKKNPILKDFAEVSIGKAYILEANWLFNEAFRLAKNPETKLASAAFSETGILRIAKLFVSGQVEFRSEINKVLSENLKPVLEEIIATRHKAIAHSVPNNPNINCELYYHDSDSILVSVITHKVQYSPEQIVPFLRLSKALLKILENMYKDRETKAFEHLKGIK